MIEVIDQMGRCVQVPKWPERIISLVPSQTELLYDLGLGEKLIGITKFCIHPVQLRKEKAVVGGTKDFNLDKIKALKPDLIIGNKEENDKEKIEALAEDFPVWMSEVSTLKDAMQMILQIGELTNSTKKATRIAGEISGAFVNLKSKYNGSCVYLIWNEPLMVAGRNTFIANMLKESGFDNLINELRYPEISEKTLTRLSPDHLLLSSEPFPFKEKHIQRFKELLPQTNIQLVDGEMFSWYGSRLKRVPFYLQDL